MAKKKKSYCPPWLIKIISCIVAYDYIVRDVGVFISVKKFLNFLLSKYDDVEVEDLEQTSALMLQFLGELKIDKNTYLLLNHFMFNIIEDIKPDEKGLFKSDPYAGMKEKKYTIDEIADEFKVFVYACRSGLTRKAPTGWDIKNDENVGELREIIEKEFSIDDMIDSVTEGK